MTAESLARELGGLKVGATWMGKCPAHDDHNPSLAIKDDDGMVLLKCHAGCTQRDVVDALKGRGLWPEQRDQQPHTNGSGKNGHTPKPPEKEKNPASADSVRRSRDAEGWSVAAEYRYGPDLLYVRFEHRTELNPKKGRPKKDYRWEYRDGDRWYSGDGGLEKPVYLNAVCSDGRQHEFILGVEGPNKAEAAAALGIPAFSLNNLNEDSWKELTAFRCVLLWPDKDTAGLNFAEGAAKRIGPHARDLRMIDPPANLPESGDIIDAIAMGMDAVAVRALIDGARRIRTGPAIREVADIPLLGSFTGIKIDWVVEGMLVAGTITALTGDAGSGKSTVATALSGAIACGQPFAGRETQQRPVLILDKENPLPILAERFQRLRVSDGEHLRVWGGWCPEEPPDVDSPIITAWVASCNPKPVLLIDSLIAFNKGDENDAGEIRKFFSALRRLADVGATVILLHHTGKGETTKDYRGSSDIKASIDVGFHLANFGDLMALSTLRLRAWKARYSVVAEMILRYSEGTFTSDVNDCGQTTTQELIQLLKENPGVRAADFENVSVEKGITRSRARSFLKGGIAAGTVRLDKGPHNTQCHVWIGSNSEVDDDLL